MSHTNEDDRRGQRLEPKPKPTAGSADAMAVELRTALDEGIARKPF